MSIFFVKRLLCLSVEMFPMNRTLAKDYVQVKIAQN